MYLIYFAHIKIIDLISVVQDIRAGIATRLGVGLSYDRGSILGGKWEFFSSPPCPHWFWGPPSLLSSRYQGSFPGSKAAGA